MHEGLHVNVEAVRDQARCARRIAEGLFSETARLRLLAYAAALDDRAMQIEGTTPTAGAASRAS
jgi:hypothetical protein